MALFLLKQCDRMRYFLNVLWDYEIEDTFEEERERKNVVGHKTQKGLNLKSRKCDVLYVQDIEWEKHVHRCSSTIVNLLCTLILFDSS